MADGNSDSNRLIQAVVTLTNVSSIKMDDVYKKAFAMLGSDGDATVFRVHNNNVEAVVEWNNYKDHSSTTHSYEIYGSSIDVTLSPQDNKT